MAAKFALSVKLKSLAFLLPGSAEQSKEQSAEEYFCEERVSRRSRFRLFHLVLGKFDEPRSRVLSVCGQFLSIFLGVPASEHNDDDSWVKADRGGSRQVDGDAFVALNSECLSLSDTLCYLYATQFELRSTEPRFGAASSKGRVGIVSTFHDGDPSENDAAFLRCLRRTLGTACHETCHILGLDHCNTYCCVMNRSRSNADRDARPLLPCPACWEKVLFALEMEPLPQFSKLGQFCAENKLIPEADWLGRACSLLN